MDRVTKGQNKDYTRLTGAQIRALCRTGEYTGPTAGSALGCVQANLVVLRGAWAADFEEFCRKNPRPCPLLEVTPTGQWEPRRSAPGADLRTDLPRYRVYEKGICVEKPAEINRWWSKDSVAFLIGCSFTFERALLEAGLPVRHIEEGRNVPMYRTNIACEPTGPFRADMVVSMRPMTPAQVRQAGEITAQYTDSHGAPVHAGDPMRIGISVITSPDYGDAVTIRPGEVPVFWACGVTPLEAILNARPDVAIVHEPGHMFVTDWPACSPR